MKPDMMWGYFLQLSNHMHDDGNGKPRFWYYHDEDYREENGVDFALWDRLVAEAAKVGVNTAVITIGDGVKYESHPEIAAPDALTKLEFKKKLDEMRALGITPIPKLNFSTQHHAWMKEYRRMVSSKIYKQVCVDLIDEMIELFDGPAYFHLGMDEETSFDSQQWREAAIMRGENLMFEDFGLFFETCRKKGARPWIWGDYYWLNPEIFERRMPRDVVISNWYYGHFPSYPLNGFWQGAIDSYEKLEKLGFDQVPTCSTYSTLSNPYETVTHCQKVLDPAHHLGYLFAPWYDIKADNDLQLLDGIRRYGKAKASVCL